MKFAELHLAEPLLRAVASEGYDIATPIQAQAIPHILAGTDVLGCAQTGTGKTAAFALPVLHRLASSAAEESASHGGASHGGASKSSASHRAPAQSASRRARCLVLCPTRELATQTEDSFRVYGKHLSLRHTSIYGGVGYRPQIDALRRGVDIIVATPGRLLDLLRQNHADLRAVEVLILDEADRMLDMGFINDIREIVAQLPARKQTLLFSATMPADIKRLAGAILKDPVNIQLAPASTVSGGIDESVYFVERKNKPALLAHLVDGLPMTRAIVFTRTKRGADRLVKSLHSSGISSEAIHGNKSQNVRRRALDNFRANKTPVLVATDVASRGIDVDGITHVVNYDITDEPETYVHRIGRTARAGAKGMAVSFCDPQEMAELRAIEKHLRRPLAVRTDHPAYAANTPAAPREPHRQHQPSRPLHNSAPSHRAASSNARPAHVAPRAAHAPRPAHASARPAHAPARPAHTAAPSAGHRPQQPGAGVRTHRKGETHRAAHPLHASRAHASRQG